MCRMGEETALYMAQLEARKAEVQAKHDRREQAAT